MAKLGEKSAKDARNHRISISLRGGFGLGFDVDIDFSITKYLRTGIILLCSDGLTNMVDDIDIRKID